MTNEVFHLARISNLQYDRRSDPQSHQKLLKARLFPEIAQAGGAIWAVLRGLFGMQEDELFLLTSWGPSESGPDALGRLPQIRITDQHLLNATVRPTTPAPLTREGVYVLRFFEIEMAAVDEFIALSTNGWTTFEASESWLTEPVGLFAPKDRTGERGAMILCTWYDGLASWEASRNKPAAGRAHFARRWEITQSSIAFATRLVRIPLGD